MTIGFSMRAVRRHSGSLRAVAVALSMVWLLPEMALAKQPIAIGTGSPSGIYYSAGTAVCDAVLKVAKYPCTVASTRGSASNVLTLDRANIQFGIVQSDVQFEAMRGNDTFALFAATETLRSLFSLHAEAFTVLVRADSPVTEFEQLRGKRLNLGPFGTGTLTTGQDLLNGLGWSEADRSAIAHIDPSQIRDALCSGDVDAAAYLIGHPSNSIAELSKACPVRIISLDLEALGRISKNKPFYSAVTIAGDTYQGNPDPVITLGVLATMVTLSSVPDDIVYTLVKATFQSLSDIRAANPAFRDLKEPAMISRGLTAPLHPGALRYYREMGWLGPDDTGVPVDSARNDAANNPALQLQPLAPTVPKLSVPKIPSPKSDMGDTPSSQVPTRPKDGPEKWDTTPPPF